MLRPPIESAQFAALSFGKRLEKAGILGSMGRVGSALDNAMAESFFATLQTGLLDRHDWPTRVALRLAIFEFVEVFYNRQRRHSSLGYLPPVEFKLGRRWGPFCRLLLSWNLSLKRYNSRSARSTTRRGVSRALRKECRQASSSRPQPHLLAAS